MGFVFKIELDKAVGSCNCCQIDICQWSIQVENVTHKLPGFHDYYACVTLAKEPYVCEIDKISALIRSSGRVPAAAKKACVQAILSLAQEQRYTTGPDRELWSPCVARGGCTRWGMRHRS